MKKLFLHGLKSFLLWSSSKQFKYPVGRGMFSEQFDWIILSVKKHKSVPLKSALIYKNGYTQQ